MRYRLIALDTDGTLNNDRKIVTPRTSEALIAVQKCGVTVVLASGRPASGLRRESLALELNRHHGLLLSYNGGRIIDATTGTAIYEKPLPLAVAKRLLKHLEAFPVTPIVDDGRSILATDPHAFHLAFESKLVELPLRLVDNVADALDSRPIKIAIAAPVEILAPIRAAIEAPFAGELSFTSSAPFYLEANAKGVSKASSLRIICDTIGIGPEAVMAFGDAHNDLSMIAFAGLGVAMGNACAELKDIADEVTLSNNEDGIAHTLSAHFP
jgi:Cof subfamily protein (haloacid dehalogenase superfamily)